MLDAPLAVFNKLSATALPLLTVAAEDVFVELAVLVFEVCEVRR